MSAANGAACRVGAAGGRQQFRLLRQHPWFEVKRRSVGTERGEEIQDAITDARPARRAGFATKPARRNLDITVETEKLTLDDIDIVHGVTTPRRSSADLRAGDFDGAFRYKDAGVLRA